MGTGVVATSRIFVATAAIVTLALALGRANDFLVYWTAGRDLRLAGWGTVYQISTLTPFKYHPVFAVLFAPLGMLPFGVAKVLWALANGLAILDMQRRWRDHWRVDAAAIGIGFLGVVHALSWEVKFANVTVLMAWLWTVAVTSERPWGQALCYAVLIALKPFWLILVIPWLLLRRWTTFGRVALLLIALSLVPGVLGANSMVTGFDRWFATFADPLHDHNYPKNDNQSWYALLFRHREALGGNLVLFWAAGSAVVGALWLWAWRHLVREPGSQSAAWRLELTLLPVMLWAAPLSWIHHQILLWPLLALGWQRAREDVPARFAWAVTWILLNGTGQFLLGRSGFTTAHQWGVPIAAFGLLAWWGPRLSGAPRG
jgi:alpha-1,2-mannosyltransferase